MQFDTEECLSLFYVAVISLDAGDICVIIDGVAIDRRKTEPLSSSVVTVFGPADGLRISRRDAAAFHIIDFAMVVIGVFVASSDACERALGRVL